MNKLISIIIPTYNRAKNLSEVLISIEKNKYPCKEIIVVDDGSKDAGATKGIVDICKEEFKTNIVYLNTGKQDNAWGLAKARNMGVVESMGDILMFLDDRLKLQENVLDIIGKCSEGYWYHGKKMTKGKVSDKEAFVENFSWIHRKDFRKFGCFNERVNVYGAMSDEIRLRWSEVGGQFKRLDVCAEEIRSSGGKNKRDQIWKAKLLLYKMR